MKKMRKREDKNDAQSLHQTHRARIRRGRVLVLCFAHCCSEGDFPFVRCSCSIQNCFPRKLKTPFGSANREKKKKKSIESKTGND